MATILPRSTWTSTSAGGSAMSMSRQRGIVVHYPAAGKDIGVLSLAQEASRLRGWRNYHVSGRGWADLGYNWAIGQSGRIHTGRGFRVGAHATGHNSTTTGVLFIVGDNEELTAEAKQAFKALRAYLRGKGVGAGVWGHQQMSGASTRCPGPYIMASVRDGSLAAGSGGGAAKPGGSGGGGGTKYKTVNKTAPLGLYDKDASNHTRIADWQKGALGYTGKDADGFFGPGTETDTKALQKQIGVKVDGLVGNDTLAAWEKAGKPKLKKAPAKPKGKPFPLAKGHYYYTEDRRSTVHSGYWEKDRPAIREIQKKVGTNIDGGYGVNTKSSVIRWQRKNGLTPDGAVGSQTWAKMFG